MQIARSSLDDPVADRTVSVIPPNTQKEEEYGDWLMKKRVAKAQALAQKSSLDDPVEDRTVPVVAPNTVKEEDLTIWLVQNRKVAMP